MASLDLQETNNLNTTWRQRQQFWRHLIMNHHASAQKHRQRKAQKEKHDPEEFLPLRSEFQLAEILSHDIIETHHKTKKIFKKNVTKKKKTKECKASTILLS